MQTQHTCPECGTLHALYGASTTCPCCGDVAWVNADGTVSRFYAPLKMMPVGSGGVPSRWNASHTRPLIAGVYEARFRHTEPDIYYLQWTGARFMAHGRPVDTLQLLAWRGELA